MSFGREVDYRIKSVLLEKAFDLREIRNVTTDKLVSSIVGDFLDISEIACVRQQIVVNNRNIAACAKNVSNKTGTDEPSTTCDQNLHSCLKITSILVRV
jgi:hypothetical protein